uniref:response regulator n=1 Tax=Kordia jejudonensis TaxID=1348245 RepID=UPI0006296A73
MQLNILYVEDNKVNAIVMDKMLAQDNILIAETGKEALDIAQARKLDLILLDINLGKNQMDGCEVLRKLKELNITSTT